MTKLNKPVPLDCLHYRERSKTKQPTFTKPCVKETSMIIFIFMGWMFLNDLCHISIYINLFIAPQLYFFYTLQHIKLKPVLSQKSPDFLQRKKLRIFWYCESSTGRIWTFFFSFKQRIRFSLSARVGVATAADCVWTVWHGSVKQTYKKSTQL